MKNQKTIINNPNFDHFIDHSIRPPWAPSGVWPCKWIWSDKANDEPVVFAFRKTFETESQKNIRIHVSADERYILYIDGERLGAGPERGDINNWFYETYDLQLSPGTHTIVAKVWADRELKAWAQTTVENGFLLITEDVELYPIITTGVGVWECIHIHAISQNSTQTNYNATGSRLNFDGSKFPWGLEAGCLAQAWEKAVCVEDAVDRESYHFSPHKHKLTPATLPKMLYQKYPRGRVVFQENLPANFNWDDLKDRKYLAENNIATSQTTLKGLKLGANSNVRFLFDLEDYCCYYPVVTATSGQGAQIGLRDSEALFNDNLKNKRDQFIGKTFIGDFDLFTTDGGNARKLETLWWRTGRFIEVCVKTADEPLTIEDFEIFETRYPFNAKSEFECSDKFLNSILPISLRSLEMCSHETFMDCPYYEQLMYIGDTRIQSLITFAFSNDYRLSKKALNMFVQGMNNHKQTPNCAYPSGEGKIIPSFSLWLIGMAYDYAKWVGDIPFVKSLMPSLRTIIDNYLLDISETGLLKTPPGWNYVDWVDDKSNKDWFYGEPNDSGTGFLSLFNLEMVHVLEMLSELETLCEEPELAMRACRKAKQLFKATEDAFWDKERSIFADDLKHAFFCEQAQVLALLCNCISEERAAQVEAAICSETLPVECSIYFTHYLFEVMKKRRNSPYFFKRLGVWNFVNDLHFSTTPEVLDDSTRSDCHAWGAHPAYHFMSSVLGIRPDGFEFKKVIIEPMLGTLEFANGKMAHPLGEIKVSFSQTLTHVNAEIELPKGLTGKLKINGKEFDLSAGKSSY